MCVSLKNSNEHGFALIEIAIILVLFSLLSAGIMASYESINRETKTETTQNNMDKIMFSAATFMQKYNRLPCPADPAEANPMSFGLERGYAFNVEADAFIGDCDGGVNELVGIVPFKSLGLPEKMVKDSWGNYITYRISSSGVINYAPFHPGLNPIQVGAHCRVKENSNAHIDGGHAPWVFPGGNSACQQNINPILAQFCCPEPDPSFELLDANGGNNIVNDTTGSQNIKKLQVPHTVDDLVGGMPSHLAIVLVSHGSNEFGAYLGNASANKVDQAYAASYTIDEQQNANGNGSFVVHHQVQADNAYYDDIVIYRTNKMLLTELGGNAAFEVCTDPIPYVYPNGDNCGQGIP